MSSSTKTSLFPSAQILRVRKECWAPSITSLHWEKLWLMTSVQSEAAPGWQARYLASISVLIRIIGWGSWTFLLLCQHKAQSFHLTLHRQAFHPKSEYSGSQRVWACSIQTWTNRKKAFRALCPHLHPPCEIHPQWQMVNGREKGAYGCWQESSTFWLFQSKPPGLCCPVYSRKPCCCSVAKLHPTVCNPMDRSMLGLPVPHHVPEFAKLSFELVMPSNYLILCCPLLLLPSIFPSMRVFSNESALCIRWPKYWSFSFSISPSNEYSRLIFSFRMDRFDLLAAQGTLKSLLQHRKRLHTPNLALDANSNWYLHIQGRPISTFVSLKMELLNPSLLGIPWWSSG